MIKLADWIIDLGPEGGVAGGQVVAMGRPEDVAKVEESYTGQWLAPLLARRAKRSDAPCKTSASAEVDFEEMSQLAL